RGHDRPCPARRHRLRPGIAGIRSEPPPSQRRVSRREAPAGGVVPLNLGRRRRCVVRGDRRGTTRGAWGWALLRRTFVYRRNRARPLRAERRHRGRRRRRDDRRRRPPGTGLPRSARARPDIAGRVRTDRRHHRPHAGGIGLLGRQYGLTCDRLVGAQVVLADGSVVDCDGAHEPELFWALRGAGGGQFGVVTALQFATVPEPLTTRVAAWWSDVAVEQVMAAWQAWAPDAPNQLTVNLAVIAEPGEPVAVTAFGAATLPETDTHGLLREFTQLAGLPPVTELIPDMPVHRLKASLSDSGEPG